MFKKPNSEWTDPRNCLTRREEILVGCECDKDRRELDQGPVHQVGAQRLLQVQLVESKIKNKRRLWVWVEKNDWPKKFMRLFFSTFFFSLLYVERGPVGESKSLPLRQKKKKISLNKRTCEKKKFSGGFSFILQSIFFSFLADPNSRPSNVYLD